MTLRVGKIPVWDHPDQLQVPQQRLLEVAMSFDVTPDVLTAHSYQVMCIINPTLKVKISNMLL